MANLKRADFAIKSYARKLDETQVAQLEFFRTLWAEQAAIAEELAPGYVAPDDDAVKALSKRKTPLLRAYPLVIEAETIVQAAARMARVLCEAGGYPADACRAIAGIDWEHAAKASACYAGSEPETCLEAAYNALAETGTDEAVLQVAVSALSLGLRALLEPASAAVMKARDRAEVAMQHPIQCPTCGCGATIALVGASSGASGGSRQLFCTQCGTTWDFDRIRCARCGTRNQGRLHYHHLGGDDTHRIHTCDECGGYIRTVFQEDIFAPLSPDVEDVVMARLDAVAQQIVSKGSAD